MLDESCQIQTNDEIADGFYLAKIAAPSIASMALPGQFVNVKVHQYTSPFLRVPLSICSTDVEAGTIDLLYEDMGPKTHALSCLPAASTIECLGPLGNGFAFNDLLGQAILVGGGIGIPPLLFLGEELSKAGKDNTHLVVGARYAAKHLPQALLTAAVANVSKTTDDGSLGHHGLVTELLQPILAEDGVKRVYTCGPHAMMKAVATLCQEYDVTCQASLEEYMACGFGVCVGCVVPLAPEIRSESPYGHYSRVCIDGPVFDAQHVCWEE